MNPPVSLPQEQRRQPGQKVPSPFQDFLQVAYFSTYQDESARTGAWVFLISAIPVQKGDGLPEIGQLGIRRIIGG
jgi:hypothetical protein